MAIENKISLDNGVETNYHRIIKVEVDVLEKKVKTTFAHYFSEEKRNEEKEIEKTVTDLSSVREELDKLVLEPTEENKDRRQELSDIINNAPQTSEKKNLFVYISIEEFDFKPEMLDIFYSLLDGEKV
ncbi:MAG: hypothetical protein PHE32_04190 [Candidatus Shapirobacteria bacterium]|nr:hypothetical protein [Candidatus Shapirobacteria bacterium]